MVLGDRGYPTLQIGGTILRIYTPRKGRDTYPVNSWHSNLDSQANLIDPIKPVSFFTMDQVIPLTLVDNASSPSLSISWDIQEMPEQISLLSEQHQYKFICGEPLWVQTLSIML